MWSDFLVGVALGGGVWSVLAGGSPGSTDTSEPVLTPWDLWSLASKDVALGKVNTANPLPPLTYTDLASRYDPTQVGYVDILAYPLSGGLTHYHLRDPDTSGGPGPGITVVDTLSATNQYTYKVATGPNHS